MSFSKQILYGLCGLFQFSLVQFLSRVLLFATPRTPPHQATLSITNSKS